MVERLAPGLYVEPPQPGPRLRPVRTDVAGFVGIAERGPVGEAVVLDGWPAFLAVFGGFVRNGLLAYAVRAYFENGGRRCYVVRAAAEPFATATAPPGQPVIPQPADRGSSIVHDAGPIAPGSVVTIRQRAAAVATGPQPADRLASIVSDARGFGPGAVAVLRQANAPVVFAQPRAADAATNTVFWREPLPPALDIAQGFSLEIDRRDRRLVAAVSGTTLSWSEPLDPRFDLGIAIGFGAGAAPAEGIIPDEDGRPLLAVSAESPGQWGDQVSVLVGRGRGAETRSRRLSAPDPTDALTVEQITGLAAGATVELVQDGAPRVRRVIAAIEPARRRLRWDAPLPAAFDRGAAASGANPIRVRRLSFSLAVARSGRVLETFSDLDLPPPAEPEASPVNRRSRLVRIRRLAGAAPQPWPDPLSGLLERGWCRLGGGRDGIAMLRPGDITGEAAHPRRRGLRAFELEAEPAALAVPDAVIEPLPALVFAPLPAPAPDLCDLGPAPPPPAPAAAPPPVEATPRFEADDVFAIQRALVEHCEARGDRIAVLDPPLGRDRPDPHDLDHLLAWRQRFDSSYAAAYFPWIVLTDPIGGPGAPTRAVPPSGHALGAIAATDLALGAQAAPANRALAWAAALPRTLTTGEHERLNPLGINAIRGVLGRGIRICGARTLASAADWQLLGVRRSVIRLKRVLERSLRWAVFEPMNARLIDTILAQIEGLLEAEWRERRLAGRVAEEAFYVRPLLSAAANDAGELALEIGVAPVRPAEFVVLRLASIEDSLSLAEATRPREVAP